MNTEDIVSEYTVPPSFPEILRELNREILRHQPTDIYLFCFNYFKRKIGSEMPETGNEYGEVSVGTGGQPAAVEGSVDLPASSSVNVSSSQNANDASDDDDASDEEGEGDYVAPEMPAPSANVNRARRTSVSAESMDPTSQGEEFVKMVIPKTDEQKSRIEKSIRTNFLFKNLDDEQYHDVVNAMAEKKVAPGEEVIKQGGIGDYFYVVETGSLDVFVTRNGQTAKVTDYGPQGSFGELALMYNAPRAATVTATTDCVLWALDRVTFRRILMENTSKKRRMYETFLEELTLLVSLEPYERQKIADVLESVTYNAGDVIIKQGDIGESFYIIESGSVTVTKTVNGTLETFPGLKKGDYFGELALLNNEPRQATITAAGKVKVASLGKKAFVRLLGPVVDIIKRNASNYQNLSSKVAL